MFENELQLFQAVYQRGAMVGERKRDKPAAGHPAADTAEDDRIGQVFLGRGGGDGGGFKSVGAPQGFEPTSGVENRGRGMAFDEFSPPPILQWIYPVTAQEVTRK
jgi:hypothetical protein